MKAQAIKYLNGLVTDETTKKEIDLIDFIKKCVREYAEEEKKPVVEWENYFEKLWKLYARKTEKQLAKKTFEHKIRGLNDEDCRKKCNNIYILQMKYMKECEENGTEMQYIKHYSSWLNASVPNSPHYKGR